MITKMVEEKYVLVSLKDESTKKIAETLTNKTCKKILNLLSENEMSGTEIAKSLSLPLNTVGYNINKLVKAGLIEEKRHLFSVKGKRIPIYKISNKHIIISPKKTYSSQLKSIFPLVFISALFTIFILWFSRTRTSVQKAIPKAEEFMISRARDFGEETALSFFNSINVVELFLIIIWIGIAIYLILNLKPERR